MKTNSKSGRNLIVIAFLSTFILNGLIKANEANSPSAWPYKNETPEQRQKRMEWWKEAKFGMFIHWGVYSVMDGVYKGEKTPGIVSWSMYQLKIPVAEYKAYAK